MKQYSVVLGGTTYPLKYTLDDREDIENLFPRPDGTPGSMAVLVREHLIGPGALRVLTVFLWAAMRHEDDKLTVDRVKALLSKEKEFTSIRKNTWRAVFVSGVLGAAIEPLEEPEKEPEESKALTPAT